MTPSHRIGTAGWAIPRDSAEAFPTDGSGLERYAAVFRAVEINTTFYRSHRASTYARWATATPKDFRFAVKMPRTLTHDARLMVGQAPLSAFRSEVEALGDKLGPLLIQLPPNLVFEPRAHERFLATLRPLWTGPIVCEPRHPSWFERDADDTLRAFEISRAAADPLRHPQAGRPGGWTGLRYWRWHGSPQMYVSSYSDEAIAGLAATLRPKPGSESWCIFDNTTRGAATSNALALRDRV